jgi:hypothetical protein
MSMGQFMPDFAQSPPVLFGDDPFSFSGEEKDSSPFDENPPYSDLGNTSSVPSGNTSGVPSGNTTATAAQIAPLFSDEDEGKRGLQLHRHHQRCGQSALRPHRRLHRPVPSDLMTFMFTDVPGMPGVVQLNVHVAVPGQMDSFGNLADKTTNAFTHHVTASVFTANVTTVYNILIASVTGSVLTWARNPLVAPKGRGDILWPKMLQRYRPKTIFKLQAARDNLLQIEFRPWSTGNSVIDHINRMLSRVHDANLDPSNPPVIPWSMMTKIIAPQLHPDPYFRDIMRDMLAKQWSFDKLVFELTELDYVESTIGTVDLVKDARLQKPNVRANSFREDPHRQARGARRPGQHRPQCSYQSNSASSKMRQDRVQCGNCKMRHQTANCTIYGGQMHTAAAIVNLSQPFLKAAKTIMPKHIWAQLPKAVRDRADAPDEHRPRTDKNASFNRSRGKPKAFKLSNGKNVKVQVSGGGKPSRKGKQKVSFQLAVAHAPVAISIVCKEQTSHVQAEARRKYSPVWMLLHEVRRFWRLGQYFRFWLCVF